MALFILRLEDRILFDAAAHVAIAHVIADQAHHAAEAPTQDHSAPQGTGATASQTTNTSNATSHDSSSSQSSDSSHNAADASPLLLLHPVDANSTGPITLLLISSSVDNAQQLANAAGNGVTAVIYDVNSTLDQLQAIISNALNGHKADNLIVTADGSEGSITLLNNVIVTGDSITNDPHMAQFWGNVGEMLNANAHVDLMSCFAGGINGNGQDFGLVSDLTAALNSNGVQHEVAAASHEIGNAPGDNWVLDVGNVNAAQFFNSNALAQWSGTLATFTVTSNADSGAGTLRAELASAAASNVSNDIINFSLDATNASQNTISLLTPLTFTDNAGGFTILLDGTTATHYAFGSAMIKITLGGFSGGLALLNVQDTVSNATGGAGSTIRGLDFNPVGTSINGITGRGLYGTIFDQNVFSNGFIGLNLNDSSGSYPGASYVTISNSYFGTDVTGTILQTPNFAAIYAGNGVTNSGYPASFTITNNTILGPANGTAIFFQNVGNKTIINSNFIGTNASGSIHSNGSNGISLASSAAVAEVSINYNTIAYESTAINVSSGGQFFTGYNWSQNTIYNCSGAPIISLGPSAPTISNMTLSGNNLTISGNFSSGSSNNYTLEFYVTPPNTAFGAQYYLGSLNGSSGVTSFTKTVDVAGAHLTSGQSGYISVIGTTLNSNNLLNQSSGTNGFTSFSFNPGTIPTSSNITVETVLNESYPFQSSDFPYSDTIPSDPISGITVVTLPSTGSLGDGNIPGGVGVGTFIPIADINSGFFQYAPPSNTTGVPLTSFTFSVDDSSTNRAASSAYTASIGVAPLEVINTLSSASRPGSLANIINAVNSGAANQVLFDLPGTPTAGSPNVWTINLTSNLPAITADLGNVFVNGTSQPGYAFGSSLTMVTINMNGFSGINFADNQNPGFRNASLSGLILEGATNGNYAVAVSSPYQSGNFTNSVYVNNSIGLWLEGTASVTGNYFGVNADGHTANGNSIGVLLGNAGNTVSTSVTVSNNVISGNNIGLETVGNFSSNTISNNIIGLNAAGTAAVANAFGLDMTSSRNNTITGNVISGNSVGILDSCQGPGNQTTIDGNNFGLNSAQTAIVANTTAAIEVSGADYIGARGGGTNLFKGNAIGVEVLSGGNADINGNNFLSNTTGVQVNSGGTIIFGELASTPVSVFDSNSIGILSAGSISSMYNCFIGVDSSGENAIPNGIGIEITGGSASIGVGTGLTGFSNIISGNTTEGILITGGSSTIANNLIGLDANTKNILRISGTPTIANAIPNPIGSSQTGGTATFQSNYYAYNTVDNADVSGNALATFSGNTINLAKNGDGINDSGNGSLTVTSNTIYSNGLSGVVVSGTSSSLFTGNDIELNPVYGIDIQQGNSTIGDTSTVNTVSANGTGIRLQGTSNSVVDNYIGLDNTGFNSDPNGTGLLIISGNASVTGNYISANTNYGAQVLSPATATFSGNKIGFDPHSRTNGGQNPNGIGVESTSPNLIFDSNTVCNNPIGVQIDSGAATFTSNIIGYDVPQRLTTNGGNGFGNGTGILQNGGTTVIGGTLRNVENGLNGNGNGIYGNTVSGITIAGGSSTITGNQIGFDDDSQNLTLYTNTPNNIGITVSSTSSTPTVIGSTNSSQRNIISDNSTEGILITAGSHIVIGNTIGWGLQTSVKHLDGGSQPFGIVITGGTQQIGGTAAGATNIFNFNSTAAINITNTGAATIQNNIIGTNQAGTGSLQGNGIGVKISSTATSTVGGTAANTRNLISLNNIGVELDAGTQDVYGNYIGTAIGGTSPLGNSNGVFITGGTQQLGGPSAGQGNVISGNTNIGVLVTGGTNSNIQGNLIGIGSDDLTAVGNTKQGVYISGGTGTLTGGTSAGDANVIAYNNTSEASPGAGITVDTALGNPIRENSIYNNGTNAATAEGIDLLSSTNANHQQLPPFIGSAVYDPVANQTTIKGTMTGTVGVVYALEFFKSPNTYLGQEGQTYLGTFMLTQTAAVTPYTAVFTGDPPPGLVVTGTATNTTTNDTSEFNGPDGNAPNPTPVPLDTQPTATNNTVNTNENSAYAFQSGDFKFSDVDPADTLASVQIDTESLPAGSTLTFNGTAVTNGQIIPIGSINLLVFTPKANTFGNNFASFTFQDIDNNGGESSPANTMTINVLEIPPTSNNITISTPENTNFQFNGSTFPYADVNNTESGVDILTVPGTGTLIDNGVTVVANQIIPLADLTGGKVFYKPTANNYGSPLTTFTFAVEDSSSPILSSVTETATVNVTPVAPTSANITLSTSENSNLALTGSTFQYSGVPAGDTEAGVKIITAPGLGTIVDNGVTVANGTLISLADLNSNKVFYDPAANNYGSPDTTFQFQVVDSSSPTPLTSATETATVNVTPVAPTSVNVTLSTPENTTLQLSSSNFNYSGVAAFDTEAGVKITSLPGAGTIFDFNIGTITQNTLIPLADLNAQKVFFIPAANQYGSPDTTFQFQVVDSSSPSPLTSATQTATVNVTPVAPTSAPALIITSENTSAPITASTFNYGGGPAVAPEAGVKIIAAPGTGAILDNGVTVGANTIISIADLNANKVFYVPAANNYGSPDTTFTFQVEDSSSPTPLFSATNTATVNVTSVVPTSAPATIDAHENTNFQITGSTFNYGGVAASDLEGGVKIITVPGTGIITDNGTTVSNNTVITIADLNANKVFFVPVNGTIGTNYTTFQFQVEDTSSPTPLFSSTNLATVNVAGDPPTAQNKTIIVNENSSYTATQNDTANDYGYNDVNGDAFKAIEIQGLNLNGGATLTFNGSAVTVGEFINIGNLNSLVFTPGFLSQASSSYNFSVEDSTNLISTQKTITFNINNNLTPIANPDTIFVDAGQSTSILSNSTPNPNSVLGNDTDPNSLTLQVNDENTGVAGIQVVTGPSHGTLTMNANGTFTYVNNGDSSITDSFTYRDTDGALLSNNATVSITVDQPPAASDKTISLDENTSYTTKVTDYNYSDPNSDPFTSITIQNLNLASGATLMLGSNTVHNGDIIPQASLTSLVFTPGTNSLATSSYTYTAQDGTGLSSSVHTIQFTMNDTIAPVGVADTIFVKAGQAVSITTDSPTNNASSLLGNDTDANNLPLTVGSFTQPSHGTVVVNPDGTFTYTNNGNPSITDSFTYTATDGTLSSSPITVNVTVDQPPTAVDKTITINENTPYQSTQNDYTYNDPNNDPFQTITITSENLAPGATLKLHNNPVPINFPILVTDLPSLVFTPGTNNLTSSSYNYTVQDSTGLSSGTHTTTFDINDTIAPVGVADTIFVKAGQAVSITTDSPTNNASSLLGNDTDANNLPLTVGSFTQPAHGTVVVNPDGTFTYTNNGNASITDSFTYTATDGTLSSNPITVNVTVDQPPTAVDKTITIDENTSYHSTQNDYTYNDPNNDPFQTITITSENLAPGATLTLNNNPISINTPILVTDLPNLVFTPGTNNLTSSSYNYTVQDSTGLSSGTHTTTFNINDTIAPVGVADTVFVKSGQSTSLTTDSPTSNASSLLGNDTDANNLPLTIGSFTQPAHGSVVVNADGTFTYTNNAGDGAISDSFQYRATDGTLPSSPVTVNITIDQPPTAVDKTININENTSYNGNQNDYTYHDPNNDPLQTITITSESLAPGATLTLHNNPVTLNTPISVSDIPNLVFTPGTNSTASSSYNFTVQDSTGLTSGTHTITLNINPTVIGPTSDPTVIGAKENIIHKLSLTDFPFHPSQVGESETSVTIVSLPTNGTLLYNGTAVTIGASISVTDLQAGKVSFNPTANTYGNNYATFQFSVQDNGSPALSTEIETATINVAEAPPTTANNNVTTTENTNYQFQVNDFPYADVNNTISAIKISSVPAYGSLYDANINGGAPITAGTIIPIAEIQHGNFYYIPKANTHAMNFTQFGFSVLDSSSTVLGSANKIITVNVTEGPTTSAFSIDTKENTPYVFKKTDFPYGDAFGSAESGILLLSTPDIGTLSYNGVALHINQSAPTTIFIPLADITSGKLIFTPLHNNAALNYTNFAFETVDSTSPSAVHSNFSIASINVIGGAPSSGNFNVNTVENTTYIFKISDIPYVDPTGTQLSGILVTSLPAYGKLVDLNMSNPITANTFIPYADINAGKLQFIPATGAYTKSYAQFGFSVRDSLTPTVLNSGRYVATINVSEALPTSANFSVSVAENSTYKFAKIDFPYADVNQGDQISGIQIIAPPTNGILKDTNLNGGAAITASTFIPIADIKAGDLIFKPADNSAGDRYATFSFAVVDSSHPAMYSLTQTVTVNVSQSNFAPMTFDPPVITDQRTAYTFQSSDFPFFDLNPNDKLAGVRISSLPTNGSIIYNNVPITSTTLIPIADIASGLLRFVPSTNSSVINSSFQFSVQDNSGNPTTEFSAPVDELVTVNHTNNVFAGIPNLSTISTAFDANTSLYLNNSIYSPQFTYGISPVVHENYSLASDQSVQQAYDSAAHDAQAYIPQYYTTIDSALNPIAQYKLFDGPMPVEAAALFIDSSHTTPINIDFNTKFHGNEFFDNQRPHLLNKDPLKPAHAIFSFDYVDGKPVSNNQTHNSDFSAVVNALDYVLQNTWFDNSIPLAQQAVEKLAKSSKKVDSE